MKNEARITKVLTQQIVMTEAIAIRTALLDALESVNGAMSTTKFAWHRHDVHHAKVIARFANRAARNIQRSAKTLTDLSKQFSQQN